jgi:PAS domain S-box-containing protein
MVMPADRFDNTGDALIFGDSEGMVRLWNVAAEKMLGFRAEKIVGKSMDLIISENLRGAPGGIRSVDENRKDPV